MFSATKSGAGATALSNVSLEPWSYKLYCKMFCLIVNEMYSFSKPFFLFLVLV